MHQSAQARPSATPALVFHPHPESRGLSPVKRFIIGDGDVGTAQTIARIRKLVHEGMTDQLVNRMAIAIVRRSGAPQFDFMGEAYALYSWVLQNFRFIRDITGVETLRTARELLTTQAGDCDDINSILLPALFMTIGNEVRLVTVATDPRDPRVFTHIYCEVQAPNGAWIPMDCARRNPAFGRGPGHFYRMRYWSLTDSSYHDLPAGRQMPGAGGCMRMGLSGYYRSMGDDSTDDSGFDWTGLATAITAGATGAANIIRATTTPQTVPPGFVRNPTTGQLVPLTVTPQGTFIASSVPGGVQTSATGTIPDWMILAGLGLVAVMAVRR